MGLAERAYDLWGRILDAQMEYVCESPYELKPDNPKLERLNGQIEEAQILFNQAMTRVDSLMPAPPRGSTAKPPPKQKPEKTEPPKPQFKAFRKSNKERSEYSRHLIETMASSLDDLHESYNPTNRNAGEARQYLAKQTTLHMKKGGDEFKIKVRNGDIIKLDERLQLLIWIGQVNGPRQAPFYDTARKRMMFVHKMINEGKLDPNDHIDAGRLWELVDELAEEGLVYQDEPDDPKLSGKGLMRLKDSGLKDKG